MIYPPAEDSYFLSEILKKEIPKLLKENFNIKFLEIGTGSGIQLETAHNLGVKKENIYSCDINPDAVKHCNLLGYNCIHSDLFEAFKGRLNVKGNLVPLRFNIIIFNPPYLPEDNYDQEKDTSGGKKGDETVLKFLQQAKNYLASEGKIFLLLSSRTLIDRINKELKNYNKKFLGNEKLFYEELFVWELTV